MSDFFVPFSLVSVFYRTLFSLFLFFRFFFLPWKRERYMCVSRFCLFFFFCDLEERTRLKKKKEMKIELQGERKSSRFSFFVGVLTGVCDTPSCFLSLALLTAVAGLVMHGWPRYAFAAGEDVPELPDARVGGGRR